jgi:hypothetical protein
MGLNFTLIYSPIFPFLAPKLTTTTAPIPMQVLINAAGSDGRRNTCLQFTRRSLEA